MNKYPKPRVIYVDVDGTLLVKGKIVDPVVKWVRKQKAKGFELVVWSSRGKGHAERTVKAAGLNDCVSCCIAKPGYIVDDMRLSWLGYVAVIHPSQIKIE